MRLGAQIFEPYHSPEEWIAILTRKNMRAAYCPVAMDAGDSEIAEYRAAAQEHDIVIAEVGAWGYSLVHEDPDHREKAYALFLRALEIGEKIGANCVVGVTGSKAGRWDSFHRENLTEETFVKIVGLAQKLLDTAAVTNTYLTFEPMPWMVPHSLAAHKRLLAEVNRPQFAVHYDPTNMIADYDHYLHNGAYMTEFIRELGAHIKACHCKDIHHQPGFNIQLLEAMPGQGELDYPALLTGLEALNPDMPLMLEHMKTEEESLAAEEYVRKQAKFADVSL